MLGVDEKDRVPGGNRKTYARSVSWSDRSPTKSSAKPQWNSKARACLPPLQPLSITRPTAEEWPCAGSDDLGVWPNNPPTPGVRLGPVSTHVGSATKRVPREFEFKKDKLAFFNKECSKIVDHIYLGSDTVAKNRDILHENGITHVLNCVGFSCPEYFKDDLVYKTLWLQDSPTEDITSILYDVFDYFEDVREQGGRVFVHCYQGVSRSTSLVIAYLMWKEGLSFEDAFQHVKAARGVTNPNMGFACQLLQCQKRVHALPVSPSSVLRMYRMAPHSPYDPLHLVPKMLNEAGAEGFDSRGAFLVLIPSAIYVWIGKHCDSVMSDNARAAAFQVIRYEKAQGPIIIINEGKEPSDFWSALSHGSFFTGGCSKEKTKVEASLLDGTTGTITDNIIQYIGQQKVGEYDLDFEIFYKALAGGVVPPFPLSGTESEMRLPARENGWSRLRRKFSSGIMKEFITASKLYSHTGGQASPVLDKMDTSKEISPALPSSPSSPQCDSPDSFSSYATSSPSFRDVGNSGLDSEPLLSPSPSFSSLDSLSCFLVNKPKSDTTSPSLSPSTSDYSSSFTFSPSSSNWSDLAYLSAQPSPTRFEYEDPNFVKNDSFKESSSLLCKETSLPAEEAFPTCHTLGQANSCLLYKEAFPSLAERRGSHPPPRMMLRCNDDSTQISAKLVRTSSFSLPSFGDDTIKCLECDNLNDGDFADTSKEELMLDAESSITDNQLPNGVQPDDVSRSFYDHPIVVADTTDLGLYQWPSMHKLGLASGFFDSRSVYIIVIPDLNLDENSSNSLYIWVGRDVQWKESPNQVINNESMCEDGHVHWEKVGRRFLIQKGLATSSLVQIVKEGEEPEQLLKHLPCFSLEKTY
uniref:Protein-tyrosine-phosphatase MKP1-like isoform X1 n=1 Tax=Nicotiana tabacum TaxID=4097 RepID=A0A1S3YXX4_TOBAC|nr:PREDICTED: protein-tyrosine-phosphatase MKP1-like isoform X1 [Nicotiana tabacum]XP_016456964.1 PREDICTED: protein-tyrosine-phosphatase MKP1-like isoform X1 [Nicotiana tabacum]